MHTYYFKKGSTNVSIELEIVDSTDGTPETGVVFNTSGIDLQYRRDGAASTTITEATLAALTTAHTDGGFLHIGNGVYRFDLPDAALASGVDKVVVHGTVTGMIVIPCVIQLIDVDLFDGVRAGLTALPNAAADAAGGLPISDAGGLDLDAMNTNINDIETDTAAMQPLVAKIPLSDGSITWNATALASVNAECDTAISDAALATAAGLTTAQNDLDIITGADGVNLLSATQTSIDAIETDTNSLNDTKVPNTLNTTASGNIGIDWANIENPTTAQDLSATSIQSVSDVTATGSAVNVSSESYVLTTGTQSSGTIASTIPLDGVTHDHTSTGGVMDLYYQFDVSSEGVPTSVTMTGRVNNSNDTLGLYAYNWSATTWEQIGSLVGKGGTTNDLFNYSLFTQHVGTGANLGKVRVRFYAASGLTSATLRIDQIYASYAVIPVSRQTKGAISDATPTTTGFNTNLTQANDLWNDALLTFTSGTIKDQSRTILTYSNTNGAVTFDEALSSAPADTDTFIITHTHVHAVSQITADIDANSTQLALIAAFNNLSAAQVNSECDTAISDAALATASALATVDTVADAIKVITDQFVFTIANQVDSNVQSINDVTITGDGSASPFDV